MSRQEKQLDAAEYVIGTLSAVERKAFEVSIENDNDTRNDVAFWDRAFGSLNASIAPEPVPSYMWERIEGALPPPTASPMEQAESALKSSVSTVGEDVSTQAANDNAVDKLRASLRRWRMSAVAATIAALGLGAFLANERLNIIPLPGAPIQKQILADADKGNEFIAVVNATGDQPSLVVNVNTKTGEVTVRSVGVTRPKDKSLELWYVPEGQKPLSVGLVGEGEIDLKGLTAKGGDLLAISLEPRGGSPTGVATGPVIYTGKLVSTEE